MIPKVIHYCWFGNNPLPELAQKCMASWKKYCPEYEIVQWDENNFDIEYNRYTKDAFAAGSWALLSDVARFLILYQHGGIYLDTDVELLRSLDCMLQYKAWIGMEEGIDVLGVNPGSGLGAEKGFPLFREILSAYDNAEFMHDKPAAFEVIPRVLEKHGFTRERKLQIVGEMTIFPPEYFAPINLTTRRLKITENTYSIHHYLGSWVTDEHMRDVRLRGELCKLLGDKLGLKAYGHYSAISEEGIVPYFRKRIKL